MNLGRLILTNGDFATRLFPNYFGQDLLKENDTESSGLAEYTLSLKYV